VSELKVFIYRGLSVTEFQQTDAAVQVTLSDGRAITAQYLVGCDGGRSLVRKKAGIEFPGTEPSLSYLIAEGETSQEPEWGIRRGHKGISALAKGEAAGRTRVVVIEQDLQRGEATLDDLHTALIAVYGTDFGFCNLSWISRFTDAARQAACYRSGRVLLAGDAAHVHSPAGGHGLNVGVQDAVNLGWKLGQVVKGIAPESLLDTYHSERHPVGAAILKSTLAVTALNRGDERSNALRESIAELAQLDQARQHLTATLSGLAVHYGSVGDHPLVGRRMPDLELNLPSGPNRVFAFLCAARPLLLCLSGSLAEECAAWAARVACVDAEYNGLWQLPGIGQVSAPSAVLIRPDGYVAWVGQGSAAGLREALTNWFGPA
jgi:hypothetical protein